MNRKDAKNAKQGVGDEGKGLAAFTLGVLGAFAGKITEAVLSVGVIIFVVVYPLCAAEDAITFVVTKDFGRPPLVEKKVPADGGSCLDILRSSADVETAYGGGFVVSIAGVGGDDGNRAWFYYVNGLLADVGASGCVPRPGDVIQWDYHAWDPSSAVSAVVGSYPQPFLSGGCSILHAPGLGVPAARLAVALEARGAKRATVLPLDMNGGALPGGHVILLGAIGDIGRAKGVGDRAGRARRFVESAVTVKGAPGPGGAGAIVAFKDGWGRAARALWLVTGTDDAGVLRAVDLLVSTPGEIEFMAGAVVTAEGVRNARAP